MGKRELLLILAFAVAGVAAYQLAAPSRPEGTSRVSIGSAIEHLRRAVRGNPGRAETAATQAHPLAPSVTDFSLRLGGATLTVTGEERDDLAVDLRVWSTGYDDAEAQSLAKQTQFTVDPAGSTAIGSISYPRGGSQRATITLKVPSRLRLRIERSGPATIDNVSAVELIGARSRSSISRVPGAASGSFRGGELTLTDVGTAKLSAQSSDVKIAGVRDLTMTVRGGELRAERISGTVELECSESEVTLDKLGDLSAPLRVNASGGTVTVNGLRGEARIDGRNTEFDLVIDRAAPIAIYSEGDESIRLTPPPGGYRLDALVREGRLTPPDLFAELGFELAKVEGAEEVRATGAVGGGGPTITVRARQGDLVLRPRSAEKGEKK